jgi:hypothetical protein
MIEPPSEQLQVCIEAFMRDYDRDAAYIGAFPTGYDFTLALDSTYIDQLEILEALCAANAEIGSDSVLYIPTETSPGWLLEQVAANDDARNLWELARAAPECYLSNPDFEWFAFSWHEPLLTIGGPDAFMRAFKAHYPKWEDRLAPIGPAGGLDISLDPDLHWDNEIDSRGDS